jgi:uncharacterized protein YacL
MGYGLGIAMIVIGLIFALAVEAEAPGIDITTLGWILTLAGIVVVVLTAVQLNMRRRNSAVRATTHPDGSRTVTERHVESDPPPPAI